MTYKEKLMMDHPELDEEDIEGYVENMCPTGFDVSTCPTTEGCDECWDREVPEDKAVTELMLSCANTIAEECAKREECEGCIFDSDGCVLTATETPSAWYIDLRKLVELEGAE